MFIEELLIAGSLGFLLFLIKVIVSVKKTDPVTVAKHRLEDAQHEYEVVKINKQANEIYNKIIDSKLDNEDIK